MDDGKSSGIGGASRTTRRRLVFYDRLSSNNAARIRIWLYLRAWDEGPEIRRIKHGEQQEPEFLAINPMGKIPALVIERDGGGAGGGPGSEHERPTKRQWLAESAVILRYLEDVFQSEAGEGEEPVRLIPGTPEDRAHMELVIRLHDLYLASPNCSQPGPFVHTQGCMYVPPPWSSYATTRHIEKDVRAAKLAECWKMLDVLESVCRGPYFCGQRMTLADLSVYPTLVFFVFYMPRVFQWKEGAVFHGRPKLRDWYQVAMAASEHVRRVQSELIESVQEKERSGILNDIIEETKDDQFKWAYP